MTTTRRKSRDAEGKFFLYVFFYHLWSGVIGLFKDGDS
ncbi:hypothetical protein [Synechococcus phage S-H25]|nr:hypothetical protein [Synechococcus phage S-H25]